MEACELDLLEQKQVGQCAHATHNPDHYQKIEVSIIIYAFFDVSPTSFGGNFYPA